MSILDMRRLLPLTCILPSALALAGGGPTGGIENLIFSSIGILFILYSLLIIYGSIKVYKTLLAKIAIPLFFIYAPIGYLQIIHYSDKRIDQEIKTETSKAALAARTYLESACKTQETFFASRKIPHGASFYLIRSNKELELLGQAPPVEITPSMRRMKKLTGGSFPPFSNEWQYGRPISWGEYAAPYEILETLDASSVQTPDGDGTTIETRRNGPNGFTASRIPSPDAEYTIQFEDISSLDDRKNWVAKGKLTILDSSTNEVIARYEGMESIPSPKAVCPMLAPYEVKGYGHWSTLSFLAEKLIEQ